MIVPENDKDIIEILKKGGCIKISSVGNYVLDEKGNYLILISDYQRRTLVSFYGLKEICVPYSRWVWPDDAK